MSLRVWLPLNGDLKNYGTKQTTITNSSSTINSSGKIGQCYYFKNARLNLSADALTDLSSGHDFSFACWYKANSIITSEDCIFHASKNSASWSSMVFWFGPRKADNKLELCIANANGGYKVAFSTSTIATNFWCHLAFTYSNGVAKIYINGALDSTTTGMISPDYSKITLLNIGAYTTSSFYIDGYLNDVRIYDHCLSPDEVKEISKALVLYYPLNDYDTLGPVNRLNTTNASGLLNSYGNWTKTALTEGGYNYKFSYTGTGSSNWHYLRSDRFTFTAGKIYKWSCKVRCNSANMSIQMRAARADNDWVTAMTNVVGSSLADGQWHEYVLTQTINSTFDKSGTTITSNPLIEFYTQDLKSSGYTFSADFDMKDIQVVESDVYIPFKNPNWETNLVKDNSGYNRHGTVTSSTCPIITTGSRKNDYCCQFDGTDDYIVAPVKQADILSDKKFTISAWTYLTKFEEAKGVLGPHSASPASGICFCQCNGNKSKMLFSIYGSSGTIYDPDGYFLNTWKYYVMTDDGSTTIVYRDGVEIARSSSSGIIFDNSTNITVGRAYNAAYRYWKGKISDVKVYATVLSAADIEKEYHRYAAIYNNHSFAANELIEDSKASVGINGVLKGNLIEGDYSKVSIIPSSGNIQATEFIEGI